MTIVITEMERHEEKGGEWSTDRTFYAKKKYIYIFISSLQPRWHKFKITAHEIETPGRLNVTLRERFRLLQKMQMINGALVGQMCFEVLNSSATTITHFIHAAFISKPHPQMKGLKRGQIVFIFCVTTQRSEHGFSFYSRRKCVQMVGQYGPIFMSRAGS